MSQLPDIYFTQTYGKLYEEHEQGRLEVFTYESVHGSVYFQFLRRELHAYKGFAQYSDIVTPYGYGGPVLVSGDDAAQAVLCQEFKAAFGQYCRDTGIVTAFVRFHPIIGNALAFGAAFDEIHPIRRTIAIDLAKDIFNDEFDSTIRNSYRNAEKRGLTIQYDKSLSTLDSFMVLYYDLMEKKQTTSYYFFPRAYFLKLRELGDSAELVNAVYDGRIVASNIYLKYGSFVHSHLTTSNQEGNAKRAVGFIHSSRALLGKQEGYHWSHLGGGFTSDPDDSLFRFKSKFSQGPPFDFYVGKSIYLPDIYEKLCDDFVTIEQRTTDFFPLYRASVPTERI